MPAWHSKRRATRNPARSQAAAVRFVRLADSPVRTGQNRLVEIYQTLNGLPALVTTAQEDERRVLPPFELEISHEGWWLPGPAPTE